MTLLRKLVPVVVILVLILENLTVQHYYSSPLNTWLRVVEEYPDDWRGWANYCTFTARDQSFPIEETIRICEKAYHLKYDNILVITILSGLKTDMGDFRGAEALARRAREAFGTHWRVAFIHAYIAQARGEYQMAIRLYEGILKVSPYHIYTVLQLASIYRELDDIPNLEKMLVKARRIDARQPAVTADIHRLERYVARQKQVGKR